MEFDILIKVPQTHLNEITSQIAECLSSRDIEERFSSNYQGDRYFTILMAKGKLTLALNDFKDFPDYQFWVSYKSIQKEARSDEKQQIELCNQLTTLGYEFSYFVNIWEHPELHQLYSSRS